MSYQSDIYNAVMGAPTVAALIGERFFWEVADETTAAPYLVAQTISTDGETLHDGTRLWSFPLIQFAAWAYTHAKCIEIAAAFRDELEGVEITGDSSVSLSFVGENTTYDPDTKLFGISTDYRASALTN
jgi:hypothetical protein